MGLISLATLSNDDCEGSTTSVKLDTLPASGIASCLPLLLRVLSLRLSSNGLIARGGGRISGKSGCKDRFPCSLPSL